MPNLQNNPNEIENEDQKYLLVTQEMINQREQGQSFLELNGIGIPDGIWRYYTGYLKAGIGMPITVGYWYKTPKIQAALQKEEISLHGH